MKYSFDVWGNRFAHYQERNMLRREQGERKNENIINKIVKRRDRLDVCVGDCNMVLNMVKGF